MDFDNRTFGFSILKTWPELPSDAAKAIMKTLVENTPIIPKSKATLLPYFILVASFMSVRLSNKVIRLAVGTFLGFVFLLRFMFGRNA